VEGVGLDQVVDRGLGGGDLGRPEPELRRSWTIGVALTESALIRLQLPLPGSLRGWHIPARACA